MWAIEKSNAFDGKYHVLGGVLSAMDGIGPEELNLKSLFIRLKDEDVKEKNSNIMNNPKCLLLLKKNQKISRNDRCEATGKKFKNCCGAL